MTFINTELIAEYGGNMRAIKCGVIPIHVQHGKVWVGFDAATNTFPLVTSATPSEQVALTALQATNVAVVPYMKLIETLPNTTSCCYEYYFVVVYEKTDTLAWVDTVDTLAHNKTFLKRVTIVLACLEMEYQLSMMHDDNKDQHQSASDLCERARAIVVLNHRSDMLYGVTVKGFLHYRPSANDFYHKHHIDWMMDNTHPRTKDIDTVIELAKMEQVLESTAKIAPHIYVPWFQHTLATYMTMGCAVFGSRFEVHALYFGNTIWQMIAIRLTAPTSDFTES